MTTWPQFLSEQRKLGKTVQEASALWKEEKSPKPKGYKVCPQCGSAEFETREDFNVRVRHYMCVRCNRNWEVPHRIIDHDLPYEPK